MRHRISSPLLQPCTFYENCPPPPLAAPLHHPVCHRRLCNPSAASVPPLLGTAYVPPSRRLRTPPHYLGTAFATACGPPPPHNPFAAHCSPRNPSTTLPLPPSTRRISTTLCDQRNPSAAAFLCYITPSPPSAHRVTHPLPFASACPARCIPLCCHLPPPALHATHPLDTTCLCLPCMSCTPPPRRVPLHSHLPPPALHAAYPSTAAYLCHPLIHLSSPANSQSNKG